MVQIDRLLGQIVCHIALEESETESEFSMESFLLPFIIAPYIATLFVVVWSNRISALLISLHFTGIRKRDCEEIRFTSGLTIEMNEGCQDECVSFDIGWDRAMNLHATLKILESGTRLQSLSDRHRERSLILLLVPFIEQIEHFFEFSLLVARLHLASQVEIRFQVIEPLSNREDRSREIEQWSNSHSHCRCISFLSISLLVLGLGPSFSLQSHWMYVENE